jgi:D-alanyl-D-alanine carboxypeptidase (penicillin-binding protein 5/6)
VALLLLAGGFQYFRALPATAATPILPLTEQFGTVPTLPWPAQGAAALYLEDGSKLGTSAGTSPLPMASTAKIMTALLVLEDHPLALNEAGPLITVTRADVATYYAERNQGESVVPVAAGEQLSEYQLLQGLLLPSASNFADLLASWDVGGVAAFVSRMNARAAALGLSATHYADVSGFSAQTVSIPAELITLARTAMRLPVFAQIVAQPQATLPVAGVVHNLDTLLGHSGVVGIKTGHTDQAGGCFVFAADVVIDGGPVRIYGAVLGQPNALTGAFAATSALLQAIAPVLERRSLVRKGDPVADYRTAWDESGQVVASEAAPAWVLLDGTVISRRITLMPLPANLAAGSRVGTLTVTVPDHQAVIPLITTQPINGPDIGWRLTRGF